MKCFRHPDQEAVGVCKSCSKGLCGQCAVDLVKGLACRDSCEQEVRGLIQMIESSMRIYPVGTKVWLAHRSNVLWTAAACVILGMLFGTWGVLNDPPLRLVAAMGAILVLWGIIQAIHAFRLRAPTEGAGRGA